MNKFKQVIMYITFVVIIAIIIWSMMYKYNNKLKEEKKNTQIVMNTN